MNTAAHARRLCYSFALHGHATTETAAGLGAGIALLPQLRGRSNGSTHLRRLFFGDLPALRHRAGIVGRTGYGMMESPPAVPPAETPAAVLQATESKPTLVRGLGLLDSILLLVSGVIGSSIFLTAKDIAGPLPQPVLFLLVWVLGAVISLCACFAFAELGSMFPDSGGQYIYLREAFGDLVAFLYGWMLFSVANGGSIAALSVAAAAYAGQVFPGGVAGSCGDCIRRDCDHSGSFVRIIFNRGADLRECGRTAMGRVAAEYFHLDKVHRDGCVRDSGIRHR